MIVFNEILTLEKKINQKFMIFEVETTIKIAFKKSKNLDIFVLKHFKQKTSLKMIKI